MDNLKFIKISDNEFTIGGQIKLCKTVTTSVIVEGVTYYNNKLEEYTINTSDLEKNYWIKYDLDFQFINKTYTLNDYNGFSYGTLIGKYSKRVLSSNPVVSAFELLFNEKVLDKRILNVYTSNRKEISCYYFEKYFDINRIPIHLCGYGFNNSVYCDIKLIDFLSIENKKLLYGYEAYKKYFLKTYDVDIDEEINFKMADKLIRKVIRDKQKQLN